MNFYYQVKVSAKPGETFDPIVFRDAMAEAVERSRNEGCLTPDDDESTILGTIVFGYTGSEKDHTEIVREGVPATQEELRTMMKDPRYWRDQDPNIVEQVRQGFRNMYRSEDQDNGSS